MAKIAQVTYGLSGKGEQYTYVVNDSVKAGQVINPSVRHHKSGTIFATTALVQEAQKATTNRGKELKEEALEAIEDTDKELVKAVSAKDIGLAKQIRGAKGRFEGSYSESGYVTIASEGEGESKHWYGKDPKKFRTNPYIDVQRGANLASRQRETGGIVADTQTQHEAQETFESYSARFMK